MKFAKDVPGAALIYTLHPDDTYAIQFLNDQASHIWGAAKERIEKDPQLIWQMTHAADLEKMQTSVARSARELSPWEMRWRIFDNNGRKKWLFGRGTPTAMDDGSIRWLTFVFDLTARVEAEAEAARSAEQLAIAIEAIPDGFALFDEKEQLVISNSAMRDIFARSKAAFIKGASFEGIMRAALHAGEFDIPTTDHENWLIERLSNFRHASKISEVRMSSGAWHRVFERPTGDGGRVAFSVDITSAKKRHIAFENAAHIDALTGLLNRQGLREKLLELQDQPGRQVHRMAVISMDLDKFKVVNDSHGQQAGDFVLSTISGKLRKLCGDDAVVARVSGDEFVIVLPQAAEDADIFKFSEGLRAAISLPCKFKGRVCQISASVGISVWRSVENVAFEQALLDAETALSQAKTMGRNRCLFFQPSMRNKALQTAQLASRLKSGLKEDCFVPHFQPQIYWPECKLHGLEAFARCKMPDGTWTAARDFVQIAEETGIIVEIDRQITTKSMKALNRLHRLGAEDATLGLNLSEALLRTPTAAELLADIAQDCGIAPEKVFIKLMETRLSDEHTGGVCETMHALTGAGFRIELGDFGTGPSALTRLRQFPIDRIKIDRSLTRSMAFDDAMRAITKGIYSLCQRMDIATIAEGIETEEELHAAQQIGFEIFQGYHFAHPLLFETLVEWLQDGDYLPPPNRAASRRA